MTNSAWDGKRILVIGGTGFVGCRVVERLVIETSAEVRVLVRSFGNAARIGRFPVEMVPGDVLDASSLRHAVEGCDIVVHCAYGNAGDPKLQKQVTIEGTRNVLQAAMEAGVQRTVYLSSLSVYGIPADGDLTEESPRQYTGTLYADSKLDAERVAEHFIREYRSPVAILQPSIIYGPYGPLWTVGILRALAATGLPLIDGGEGLCNAVYLDDVVTAILVATTHPAAAGETFLISASEPVTWREFYGAYEDILGISGRTIPQTTGEAEALYRSQQKDLGLARVVGRLLGNDEALRETITGTPEMTKLLRTIRRLTPAKAWKRLKSRALDNPEQPAMPVRRTVSRMLAPGAPHPIDIRLQRTRAAVRIDKAINVLGFRPEFDLQKGMQVTGEWARWANLVDG
jgi:nucleoside-diphosphate-sugar epimerase